MQRRIVYHLVVPMTLVPLKSKRFKVKAAGEKQVGDKSAVGLKVTGPDGKDFSLFFDKDSGLPVLLVAKIATARGDEVTQETTFADYKEFDGIKKATVMTESCTFRDYLTIDPVRLTLRAVVFPRRNTEGRQFVVDARRTSFV
jgi:hypothetical protein